MPKTSLFEDAKLNPLTTKRERMEPLSDSDADDAEVANEIMNKMTEYQHKIELLEMQIRNKVKGDIEIESTEKKGKLEKSIKKSLSCVEKLIAIREKRESQIKAEQERKEKKKKEQIKNLKDKAQHTPTSQEPTKSEPPEVDSVKSIRRGGRKILVGKDAEFLFHNKIDPIVLTTSAHKILNY